MPATITLQQLKKAKACRVAQNKFHQLFGQEVIITIKLCMKHSQDFDYRWASGNLLTAKNKILYNTMTDSALSSFNESKAQARDNYTKSKAQLRNVSIDEYDKAIDLAQAIWIKAIESAWEIYSKIAAKTFAELYLEQQI